MRIALLVFVLLSHCLFAVRYFTCENNVRKGNKLHPDQSLARQWNTILPCLHKASQTTCYKKRARFFAKYQLAISYFGSSSWFQGLVSSLVHRHLPPAKTGLVSLKGKHFTRTWVRHPRQQSSIFMLSIPNLATTLARGFWLGITNHYLKSAAYNQVRQYQRKVFFKKGKKSTILSVIHFCILIFNFNIWTTEHQSAFFPWSSSL